MTVAIVTDSAAAMPAELSALHQISVVPMWIHLGDETIAEGQRPMGEFVGDERVTTSAPAPGDYERVIRRRLDEGAAYVVVLTIAASMSASHHAATVAARAIGNRAHVVDTNTAAGGQALVVLAAAAVASAGGSSAAVMAEAAAVATRIRLLGMVPRLDHLVRSGRVPGLAGWAGRALGINPLFELRDGHVKRLRPAIGSEAAIDRMVARFLRSRVPDARATRLRAARRRPRRRGRAARSCRRRGRRGRRLRERVLSGHGRPYRARSARPRVVVGTGVRQQYRR